MIDPTIPEEFQSFAIEAWMKKVENLRLVVDLWHRYLMHAIPETDIRKDPASKLIIALLATQTKVGIHDISIPRACTEEIRRERN